MIKMQDPPVNNDDGFPLDLAGENFLFDYYKPFLDLLNSDMNKVNIEVAKDGRKYRIKRIEEIDIWIGLDDNLYELLYDTPASNEIIKAALPERSQPLSDVDKMDEIAEGGLTKIEPDDRLDNRTTVGGDGVYVRVGDKWDSEKMKLPPTER